MKSLLLIIFLVVQSTCFSQWIQQQSNTSFHLNGVCMINSNTGFIAGDYQTVRMTSNGGSSWLTVSVPNWDYGKISFLNINTGIIAAGPGALYIQTNNGGANWILRYSADEIGRIQYIDSNIIYATGGYSVQKSANGGNSWFWIDTAIYYLQFRSLFFVNKDTGVVVGAHALVQTTTNGGNSWITRVVGLPVQFGDSTLYDVKFVNYLTGFASGNNGIVIKTTDGGINWIYKPTGNNNALPAIFFSNALTGTVVGYPYIGRTTDGGDTWVSQSYPTNEPLRDVFFINSYTGWIAGFNGLILFTSNGGLEWINKNVNNIPINFYLYQNYPNPFNPLTNIKYQITKSSFVKLKVFDFLGREITTLVNENKSAGIYEVNFDGGNYASGVYFYKITAGQYNNVKKMVLMK